MASLDTSIANAVLPTIALDVHASPAASIWVVNAYQLALVMCLLPFASLGEIFGYRRVYCYGLAVFTFASLVCALSYSLGTLTAARVLQGVGAAGIMSVNTALIRFIYPGNQLGRGVGFNAIGGGRQHRYWPHRGRGRPVGGKLGVAVRDQRAGRGFGAGIGAAGAPRHAALVPPIRYDQRSAECGHLRAADFRDWRRGAQCRVRARTVAVLLGALALGTLLVRRQLGLKAPMLPVDL